MCVAVRRRLQPGDGGAFTLADSLTGDIATGLRAYQARHRRLRAAAENSVATATRLLIPATAAGIAVRETVFRHTNAE